MDAVYLFRHSVFDDQEIRYSLRSIQKHLPCIRKVWIFGDRPAFLSDDTSIVEHVPQSAIARIADFPTPVTNFFHMMFLSSLIPELDAEYLLFCDDFILIDELPIELARQSRYLADLGEAKSRGHGLWLDCLWRTYDLLKRLGYPGHNFETHTPTYLRRQWVLDAYCDFKDFTTHDRFFGMLGPTAILNHVVKHKGIELTHLATEGTRAGFWHEKPTYEAVVESSRGKLFFNFDDDAYGDAIRRFLSERFPDKSIYEKSDIPAPASTTPRSGESTDWYPPIIMKNRSQFGEYLNGLGLDGDGVEVGTGHGKFAEEILRSWRGRLLHCVDPWVDMTDDTRYVDRGNVSQDLQDRNYEQAKVRLTRFGERCRIHRRTSRQAAEQIADRSLDFAYLDSRHYREAVTEDLELWAPKIRPGGILAGHDYLDGVLPSGIFEVKSAVDAWACKNNRAVTCSGEHVWRSWFIPM